MKRTILATLISILTITQATAQVTNGFYRIQNYASTRYITITDDIIGGVNMASTDADLSNITTWRGFDHVKSNPASIIYVEQVSTSMGTQYNLKCQGTSIYQIAGGKTYLDLIEKDYNTYVLSVTYSGVSARLFDTTKASEEGYVVNKKPSNSNGHDWWKFLPVNTDDNYVGLQPTVQIGDDWYGTVYASYAFKVASSGVKIYYVDGVKEGVFQIQEVTGDIIPEATPLLFKCSSSDPAQNKIIPVTDAASYPKGNLLSGTYFASTVNKHEKYVEYDASTMRILGKNDAGELVFTTATKADLSEKKYIPANTCWLNVPSGIDGKPLTGDFKLVSRNDYTGIHDINSDADNANSTTYTLTGVKVQSKNPKPGIYIRNGKKIIIK